MFHKITTHLENKSEQTTIENNAIFSFHFFFQNKFFQRIGLVKRKHTGKEITETLLHQTKKHFWLHNGVILVKKHPVLYKKNKGMTINMCVYLEKENGVSDFVSSWWEQHKHRWWIFSGVRTPPPPTWSNPGTRMKFVLLAAASLPWDLTGSVIPPPYGIGEKPWRYVWGDHRIPAQLISLRFKQRFSENLEMHPTGGYTCKQQLKKPGVMSFSSLCILRLWREFRNQMPRPEKTMAFLFPSTFHVLRLLALSSISFHLQKHYACKMQMRQCTRSSHCATVFVKNQPLVPVFCFS